jgi:hypothetical protein
MVSSALAGLVVSDSGEPVAGVIGGGLGPVVVGRALKCQVSAHCYRSRLTTPATSGPAGGLHMYQSELVNGTYTG